MVAYSAGSICPSLFSAPLWMHLPVFHAIAEWTHTKSCTLPPTSPLCEDLSLFRYVCPQPGRAERSQATSPMAEDLWPDLRPCLLFLYGLQPHDWGSGLVMKTPTSHLTCIPISNYTMGWQACCTVLLSIGNLILQPKTGKTDLETVRCEVKRTTKKQGISRSCG